MVKVWPPRQAARVVGLVCGQPARAWVSSGSGRGGDIAVLKVPPPVAIFSNYGTISTAVSFPEALLMVIQSKK